jgi:thiol-disulfide isomerase/thioredoxin
METLMFRLTDRPAQLFPVLGVTLVILMFAGTAGSGPQPSRAVPAFQLRLLDGKPVRSKDLKGKITVIDFWGTWCRPCIAEIPGYNEFYREYKDRGVLFFAPALDSGTEDEVREAVRKLRIEYPVAAPSLKELDAFGDIEAVPTTWVVNKRGELEEEFLGTFPGKQESLRAIVDRLLAAH